ncbi:MAG: RluA family pseudouridine synthase [Peptoniphilus sp.]|nr:RluA family pseudouridine synthase [Peptoniphilus sp.]MDD7363749.1 RluA family pseudouridine synthase [Bacillota bacterium]MDY6044134.1 RluA family pseudouridine synthase [Peptoniphilus sp.]
MQLFISERDGERLDQYMTGKLPLNRSQVKRAIVEGRINVNGAEVKAGYKLKVGDRIAYEEEEEYVIVPKDLYVPVLYEDEHIACVNKPYGLVVHPGAGREEETLVHDLLFRFGHLAKGSDPLRPGIVHRLDKDTSGVMVIAKDDEAYAHLVESFKARTVQKCYYAICRGIISQPGEIDSPIGRDPHRRMQMAADVYPSKPAYTTYEPVLIFRDSTLLRVRIHTGRTHQIRVHMKSIDHPVLGDPIYGAHSDRQKKLLLHSYSVAFKHPVDGRDIRVFAPLPERFLTYIRKEKSDRCIRY